MPTLYVAAKINATNYGPLGSGVGAASIDAVSFGGFAADTCAFDIRHVKVGTTGYGSSDLFAPLLDDLSEFDGLIGDDGSLVASGGVLAVDSASGDHYGWKAIGAVTANVYVHFELRVRGGDGDPDYCDIWATTTDAAADGPNLDGIFNGGTSWRWNGPGDSFGSGPTGSPTWDTVNLTFSLVAPAGPGFHIAS